MGDPSSGLHGLKLQSTYRADFLVHRGNARHQVDGRTARSGIFRAPMYFTRIGSALVTALVGCAGAGARAPAPAVANALVWQAAAQSSDVAEQIIALPAELLAATT